MMNAKIESRYNVQFAKGYIVYMMVSSYFKSAVCLNKREETHLYLHYCEMPQQKQLKQEEYVIKTIEKIDKNVLKRLENLQCKVIFEKVDSIYTIRFLTGLEEVIAEIDPKGMIDIRVYSKLNRDVVACEVVMKKENGKDVLCFQSGLEELLQKVQAGKQVNMKLNYRVEQQVDKECQIAA